jgi:hypothetical protein
MNWIVLGVVSVLGYEYAKRKGWLASLFGNTFGNTVTCDIESDMPASLKNVVLGEVATEKDPNKLIQLAQTFNPLYPQAAYCLMRQAWVLLGKKGPEPQPPTQTQIASAATARAAQSALAAASPAAPGAAAAAAAVTPPPSASVAPPVGQSEVS